MNDAQMECEAALTTARHALEQFNAEPMVASKRGGPRLSPWWRVYVQASGIAARWHREAGEVERKEEADSDPFGDALERLLDEAAE